MPAPVFTVNGLVPGIFDYVGITYTDGNPTQVVYRRGGEAGAIVSTLNLEYDEDGNVETISKA